MINSLLHTLLHLGHCTSQNIDFAHKNRAISYSEETITETNLLELRRRHSDQVKIWTFSKRSESVETGADWEWHVVGTNHTLKMRVQAKRVTMHGKISGLYRQAKTSPKTQIDLLIGDADHNNLKPVYCFYCSEEQRRIWVHNSKDKNRMVFESGCLLADANDVVNIRPKNFFDIECETVPWHYICQKQTYEFFLSHFYKNIILDMTISLLK